jgi:hypothetical protein
MARPHEKGIDATFRYQRVKYNQFGAPPEEPMLLTADPWSYLFAWLQQNSPRSGLRKERFDRALYFAQQAEEFYEAAQSTGLPAQGTLAYYGMLNLVKCFISIRGTVLEETYEHHGLQLPLGSPQTIKVAGPGESGLGIFQEFARHLDTPVTGAATISLKAACSHLPEVHEIAYALDQLALGKRKFLPVDIRFCVNDKKTHVFTQIEYEKKNEMRVNIRQFNKGARKEYFKKIADRPMIVYRSIKRKAVSDKSWPRIFRNICKEYEPFHIASLLSRSGYKFYCDLRPGDYHHLCYSLLVVYYVGTISRYRPTETRELLSGPFRPIVTEAVSICPRQFLYQLISLTTNKVCVIPYAKL